ncbi:MAG TPA: hypothetical protein VM759_05825, partial [Longimicrobium sp.]|nr:hypothetical protein [Longimicrobium sp.]
MSAHIRFLSWIREGLASAGAGEDVIDAPLPDRGEVKLTVNLTQAGSAELKVRLLGPGDVTGIDPRQVIRTEPRAWTTDFEPNYFAAIELDRPELPWLFTPAKEEAERGRLRPWMALVVVPEDAPGVALDTHPRNPLPVLTAPRGELPDPAEGWAWAHAQLTLTSASEDPATVLAKHPDRTLARIICPRRLEPDRMYLACLVPAFEAGRRAGLGLDPAVTPVPDPGREPGDYAWSREPEDAPCDPFPVYYHWRFGTSPAGDFESLVRRLDRVSLPAGTGLRPMDVSRPEGGMPEDLPAAVLGMEGALRAPTTLPTPWDEGAREPFQAGLEAVLAPAGERLTPPVYGAVHAGVEGLPEDGRFPWLR